MLNNSSVVLFPSFKGNTAKSVFGNGEVRQWDPWEEHWVLWETRWRNNKNAAVEALLAAAKGRPVIFSGVKLKRVCGYEETYL